MGVRVETGPETTVELSERNARTLIERTLTFLEDAPSATKQELVADVNNLVDMFNEKLDLNMEKIDV